MTVLVYLFYLPRTPALLFFFCLVPFGVATQVPVLSRRSQSSGQTTLQFCHLYASIIYIILDLVPFHYLSLLRTLTISATDSLSLEAPVATAFIIKYILFFTLSCILFTSYLFFTYVPMILVKSPIHQSPHIFLVLPHFPNI